MNLERTTSERNLRTGWIAAVAVFPFLLPPACGFQAQSPSRANLTPLARPKAESSGGPPPTLRVDSSLVQIPVRATTVIGTPVQNLTKADFRLFEDGIEQTIAEFAIEEQPVSVVIVFDASGSMKKKVRRSQEAAAALLRWANPEDEFSLVKFNGKPRVAVPFTVEAGQVVEEIERSKASGYTSLMDAVYLALAQMKHARNPRRGIVIVSDGGDNWSRHSIQAIRRLLTESDTQLFAMGIYDADYEARHYVEERNGPRLLDDLARQTGGREYAVDNREELPAIGERIRNALRSEYVLGYYPSNKAQDGKYRNVTLRINTSSPSSQIRLYYRQGYYAVSE